MTDIVDVDACVEALKAAEAALSASCHTATYRATLRALASALPGMGKDSERLDWLETMVVNVRTPTRFGSWDVFWASPEYEDVRLPEPSAIRAKIDAARAAQPEETRP